MWRGADIAFSPGGHTATFVNASLEGHAYFPDWDKSSFECVSRVRHPADEKHEYSFTFETWKRKG